MNRDSQHPIIDRPYEYDILAMHYQAAADEVEPFLDLTLGRGELVRRLRFFSPRDLKIEKGFPVATGGMEILDVSVRQMEGIGVLVGDFESSPGSITFWARKVVDLDTAEANQLADPVY